LRRKCSGQENQTANISARAPGPHPCLRSPRPAVRNIRPEPIEDHVFGIFLHPRFDLLLLRTKQPGSHPEFLSGDLFGLSGDFFGADTIKYRFSGVAGPRAVPDSADDGKDPQKIKHPRPSWGDQQHLFPPGSRTCCFPGSPRGADCTHDPPFCGLLGDPPSISHVRRRHLPLGCK
jgi:hypothetical protein